MFKNLFGKKDNKKQLTVEELAVQKSRQSAQEWLPVQDVYNSLLHRKDDGIVAFIKIHPVNMDLLSKEEQKRKIRGLFEVENQMEFPVQTLSIERPVDLDGYILGLQEQKDNEQNPMKKKLLEEDIRRAVMLSSGGEAVERQFYYLFSDKKGKNEKLEEESLLKRAHEIAAELSTKGLIARVCDDQEIRDLQFLFGNTGQASFERAPQHNGPYVNALYTEEI